MKVSVVLPTFNEKGNVIDLIKEVHKQLEQYDHEILVIDDNSPDGTYKAVCDLGYSFVTPILRKEDHGFAKSIRCGLEQAEGDTFVIMDSDFNHQPQYLPFMIQSLSHYNCISGTRFVYGGKMQSRFRHVLSWIFNIFIRFMTGTQITDSLYGFIVIKKEVIEKLKYDDIFWGYGDYCIRLMFYLQKIKEPVLQIPMVNGDRRKGQGNSSFFKVFLKYFNEVIKLTLKIRFTGKKA